MRKSYSKFWRIARRLQKEQLQKTSEKSYEFSDRDLFELDIGRRGGGFFLGFYSKEGIILALEKYGVFSLLKQKGYPDIYTDINTQDPYKHRIAFYRKAKSKKNLIIEMVLRKDFFELNMPFTCKYNGQKFAALVIDWLLFQNIEQDFTLDRPRLPGQRFPGLGLSGVVLELLLIICWRLNLDGIINVPEHYHNAYLYAKMFRYLDPKIEAKLIALQKTFKKMPLAKLTWGIEWNCVRDLNTNQPLVWFAQEQILPMHKELQKIFKSNEYKNSVQKHISDYRFRFDEDKFAACREKLLDRNADKCI